MHLQLPSNDTDILVTILKLTAEPKVVRKVYRLNSTFKCGK